MEKARSRGTPSLDRPHLAPTTHQTLANIQAERGRAGLSSVSINETARLLRKLTVIPTWQYIAIARAEAEARLAAKANDPARLARATARLSRAQASSLSAAGAA